MWLVSVLALPGIWIFSPREGRGDRLLGAWIMLALQAVVITLFIILRLAAAE